MRRHPQITTLFPYTTLFRSLGILADEEKSAYSAPVPLSKLPDALRKLALEGELLIVDKANDQQRSEEHTSELQSRRDLVCRLLLEKKKQLKCAFSTMSLILI